jgi:hypothetical protein
MEVRGGSRSGLVPLQSLKALPLAFKEWLVKVPACFGDPEEYDLVAAPTCRTCNCARACAFTVESSKKPSGG